MNKFDLVLLIIKFMKDNHHLKIVDLGFKNPLELLVDNDYKLVIEKYYEFDITVSQYKNDNRVMVYQEYYQDLPINILQQIYDQIQIYSIELEDNKQKYANA